MGHTKRRGLGGAMSWPNPVTCLHPSKKTYMCLKVVGDISNQTLDLFCIMFMKVVIKMKFIAT